MPNRIQTILAHDTEGLEQLASSMGEQGYIPIGAISCGTREETIQHPIKGETVINKTVLRQSFWYVGNVDSASLIAEQVLLLQSVVNHTHEAFSEDDETVEVDRDIIGAVEDYLRGVN